MWCSAVERGDPLSYQQMVGVHLTIRKSALSSMSGVRRVPIDCLHSHRPTNPRRLRAHLSVHYTGNQLPRQPQKPLRLSRWIPVLRFHVRSSSHLFGSFPSTSVCPVITSDAQILTLQTNWGSEMIETNTVLHHSYTMRRLIKLPVLCLRNVGQALWNTTDTYPFNSDCWALLLPAQFICWTTHEHTTTQERRQLLPNPAQSKRYHFR